MVGQIVAIWVVFGEWLMALTASAVFCWAIRHSKMQKLAAPISVVSFLLLLCLIQRPWRPEGKLSVVAQARFGSTDVAVVQVHDASSLNFISFAERDAGGPWREYFLEKEAPFWLSAGFHQPNPNEISITRLGVHIATFRIKERELVLELPAAGRRTEGPNEERSVLCDRTFEH